jgi:hypothetical protein
MTTMRQRRLRALGSMVLAALLLVPVLASGHHHAAHPAVPCATCAVTQHTPVVSAPAVATPSAAPVVVALVPVAVSAPVEPARRRGISRGPPAPLLMQES